MVSLSSPLILLFLIAAVIKHFDDIQEDQFDFHSYCLRKVTLRAYMSVLRYEDVLYGHEFFCRAAEGIIRIYLQLHDNPAINESDEPDYSKMTAAERKKAKAVARKKKKASEKKEEDRKIKATNEENGSQTQIQKDGKPAFVDEDPMGKEYLEKDPLVEAKRYSSMLTKYAPTNLATWFLQYDVAVRQKKPLLALQALFKARSIDLNDSELFLRTVDFADKIVSFEESNEVVRFVLAAEFPSIMDNKSVEDFVDDFVIKINENPLTDLPLRTAVVKTISEKKPGSLMGALDLIMSGGIHCRNVSVETTLDALEMLKSIGPEATNAVEQWTDAVQKRFPYALSNYNQ